MTTLFTSGRFLGFDSSGNPLSGGKLYTYEAGTTTAKATFTTRRGGVANANPVILNSAGRASVWLGSGAYRVILKDADDVTLYDDDNIAGADSFSVTDYGAVGDGTTDDRAAIQAAIDAAEAVNGTVVIPHTASYYRIALALQAKSGVTVLVQNNATRIVSTGDGSGASWPTYGVWMFGSMSGTNYARCTAYAADAITVDDRTITLTTAGDSANFAVGDVVAVETTTNYTVGSDDIPVWLQMNVVTSSAAGVIGLRHAIDTTQASVQLRQLTTELNALAADGVTDTGRPLKAVRDFSVIGGTWETEVLEAPWEGGGGCVDCTFKPHKVRAATGPAYGNAYGNCTFDVDVLIARRHPVELAWGSHSNTVRVGAVSFEETTLDPNWYVALNEGARNNRVSVGTINGRAVAGANARAPIYFGSSYENRVEVQFLTGASMAFPVVLFQTSTATNAPESNDNSVYVGRSYFPSQVRYIGTAANSERNSVIGNFYGTCTNDALSIISRENVIDGYFQSGTLAASADGLYNRITGHIGTDRAAATDYATAFKNAVRLTSDNLDSLKALQFRLTPDTYSNGDALSKTVTFPAASFLTGDTLAVRLCGVCAGTAGNRVITVTFAGSTVYTATISTAIAFDINGTIVITSDAVAVGSFTGITGTASAVTDTAISGKDFTNTAYDLVVSITVASGGDSCSLRYGSLEIIRTQMDGKLL